MTDLSIIGAGPAGLTAAVYGIRAGFRVAVFEALGVGGQLATTPEVENYPAIEKISGWDLAARIEKQATALGAEIRYEAVTGLRREQGRLFVHTTAGDSESRAVIVANGVRRRKLGCPGEAELTGRGVSYCAVCDGAFFRGKPVAVVGGGNTAMEDALFLANLCPEVLLAVRGDSLKGERPLLDAVAANEKIRVLTGTRVTAIEGRETVEQITLAHGTLTERRAVSGVFVAIGLAPDNGAFGDLLRLDEGGYVVTDASCATSVPGVYAAGDTRSKSVRQIITAAADGAIAATMAAAWLHTNV